MKILLNGLPENADAEKLKERMSHFGPVLDAYILQCYEGKEPIWVVEMDIDAGTATEIALRIDNIWFQGKFIRAYVPLHP